MGTNAYYLNQFISTTLATVGGIDDSQTTGIILTSVTGVETTKPGIVCLSYSDPIDTSKAEWISYTSIDVTNELQGVTRGAEGFSAKSHSNGVTIAFPISESHINNLNDALIIGGSATNLATGVIDDDTFATASATTLATSESIKAYVDNGTWLNGWNLVTETWTRTGNHTFTVAGDLTAKYRKGTKVRYKDGGADEYGVIGSSSYSNPNTTITLITNNDYAMAAATITDTYISYIENPEGFPHWFSYTPTIIGNSGSAGTFAANPYMGRFCIIGHMCTVQEKIKITNLGSWGGVISITLPVPASTNMLNEVGGYGYIVADSANPVTASKGAINIGPNANTHSFLSLTDAASVTFSDIAINYHIRGIFTYEI